MLLIENVTLTGLMKYLNLNSKTKKSKSKFTVGDIQGYIRRGHLPMYMGGNRIINNNIAHGVKLYNLEK